MALLSATNLHHLTFYSCQRLSLHYIESYITLYSHILNDDRSHKIFCNKNYFLSCFRSCNVKRLSTYPWGTSKCGEEWFCCTTTTCLWVNRTITDVKVAINKVNVAPVWCYTSCTAAIHHPGPWWEKGCAWSLELSSIASTTVMGQNRSLYTMRATFETYISGLVIFFGAETRET